MYFLSLRSRIREGWRRLAICELHERRALPPNMVEIFFSISRLGRIDWSPMVYLYLDANTRFSQAPIRSMVPYVAVRVGTFPFFNRTIFSFFRNNKNNPNFSSNFCFSMNLKFRGKITHGKLAGLWNSLFIEWVGISSERVLAEYKRKIVIESLCERRLFPF